MRSTSNSGTQDRRAVRSLGSSSHSVWRGVTRDSESATTLSDPGMRKARSVTRFRVHRSCRVATRSVTWRERVEPWWFTANKAVTLSVWTWRCDPSGTKGLATRYRIARISSRLMCKDRSSRFQSPAVQRPFARWAPQPLSEASAQAKSGSGSTRMLCHSDTRSGEVHQRRR